MLRIVKPTLILPIWFLRRHRRSISLPSGNVKRALRRSRFPNVLRTCRSRVSLFPIDLFWPIHISSLNKRIALPFDGKQCRADFLARSRPLLLNTLETSPVPIGIWNRREKTIFISLPLPLSPSRALRKRLSPSLFVLSSFHQQFDCLARVA